MALLIRSGFAERQKVTEKIALYGPQRHAHRRKPPRYMVEDCRLVICEPSGDRPLHFFDFAAGKSYNEILNGLTIPASAQKTETVFGPNSIHTC